MITLVRKSKDHYLIFDELMGVSLDANEREMIEFLLKSGVKAEELEKALIDMLRNEDHFVCEFGINGDFLYSRPAQDNIRLLEV